MVKFFTEDNWSFTQINKQSSLRLAFKGENEKCDCYAIAREKEKQFIFLSVCPIKVPKTKRRAVGEFLLRVNCEGVIGSFELDFDDGEIRHKTSIEVQKNSLDSQTIKSLAYTSVMMMDRYLPGIELVIAGLMSPGEAIVEIKLWITIIVTRLPPAIAYFTRFAIANFVGCARHLNDESKFSSLRCDRILSAVQLNPTIN